MEEIRSAPSSWKDDLLDYAQGISPYRRQFNEKILDTVLAPVSGIAGFRDTFVNQISGIDTSPLDYFLESLNFAPLGVNGKQIKSSIDALVNRKMMEKSAIPSVTQTEPLKSFKDTLYTEHAIRDNGKDPRRMELDIKSSRYPDVPLAMLDGEIFKVPHGTIASVDHFYPTRYPLRDVHTPWDKVMDNQGRFIPDENGFAISTVKQLIDPHDLGTGFMKNLADILKKEEPEAFGIMANRISGARARHGNGSEYGFWPLKKLNGHQRQFREDLLGYKNNHYIQEEDVPILSDEQRQALEEVLDDIPF